MEREVSEVDRKLILKKTYLDRIYYHLTRNPLGQDELYQLVRKFFGEYLKLDYEFTYEELSQELNKVFIRPKVKEHIDDFLIRLSESEYLEESHMDANSVNVFLRELDEIIRNMIYEEDSAQEEGSLIEKVLKRKGKERGAMDATSMNAMIEELNFHISNGNLDIAKSSYINLIKAYDDLSKADKKRLHDPMNEVYERLQTLIKNPKQQKPLVPEKFSTAVKYVKDLMDETMFYINASNLASAKHSYSEMLKAYDSLDSDDKKMLHSAITDIYMQIQGLSSRPVRMDAQAETLSRVIDEGRAEPIPGGGLTKASPDMSEVSKPSVEAALRSEVIAGQTGQASSIAKEIREEMHKLDVDIPLTQAPRSETSEPQPARASDGFRPIIAGASTDVSYDVSSSRRTMSVSEDDRRSATPENSSVSNLSAPEILGPAVDIRGDESGNMLFIAGAPSGQSKARMANDMSGSMSRNMSGVPQPVTARAPAVPPANTASSNAASKPSTSPKPIAPSPTSSPVYSFASSPTMSPAPISAERFDIMAAHEIAEKDLRQINQSGRSGSDINDMNRADVAKPADVKKERTAGMTEGVKAPVSYLVPAKSASDIETDKESHAAIDSLNGLLDKIMADIVLDRFAAAKETYKEALIMYRQMNDSQKSICYDKFYSTFQRLDETLHQRSLHDLLDKHTSDIRGSKRTITANPSSAEHISNHGALSPENLHEESMKVSKMTTLPVMLSNDEQTTRVYELIEESYFNVDNKHPDLAMLKYFKALDLYRKLPLEDKKKLYSVLHDLFKKLSPAKVAHR